MHRSVRETDASNLNELSQASDASFGRKPQDEQHDLCVHPHAASYEQGEGHAYDTQGQTQTQTRVKAVADESSFRGIAKNASQERGPAS